MIEVYSNTRTQLIADRIETRQKIASAVALGLPLLADTNLVWEGATIGKADVIAMRKLDLCGKRKPDGGISTFDEVLQYHKTSRKCNDAMTGLKPLYPSQRLLTPDVIVFSEKVYRKMYTFFEDLGINLEIMRRSILKEEKESSIQAVIFDVGDVLVPNPDPAILAYIVQSFEIDPEVALKVWQVHTPPMQTGKITEEAFWQEYATAVDKSLPSNFTTLLTAPVCTQINPEMRTIIDQVKQRGLKLGILSNTILAHVNLLRAQNVYEGFDAVSLSLEIRVTKGSDEAFKIAALKLWLPPQACIFIDDRESYVDRANCLGMKGIHFKFPQQLEMALQEK